LFRRDARQPPLAAVIPRPLTASPPTHAEARSAVPRDEDRDISAAEGIGPKRADALRRRGIGTFGDAVLHLPYRYRDLRRRDHIADLQLGMDTVIEGQLEHFKHRPLRGSRMRSMATAVLRDRDRRVIDLAWFNLPSYVQFPLNQAILIAGRVSVGTRGTFQIVQPEVFRHGAQPLPIEPVYSLPHEVQQRLFAGILQQTLKVIPTDAMAALPPSLRLEAGLPGYYEALSYLHRPPAEAAIAELASGMSAAHQALALDEMFAFQIALAREKQRAGRRSGIAIPLSDDLEGGLAQLPFGPTGAQVKAIREIEADLAQPSPMNRMLIGDVGSGKTLVAFHAVMRIASAGYQAVMMAPTQLLAEQHYRNFLRDFQPVSAGTPVMSTLLTAKLVGAERLRMLRAIERGDIAVVFGTQALIQEEVKLGRLGLAVIDEQHRFGVFERARLKGLGPETNVLSMTATPIPRSLALMLFRNLEVSVLDEMPPGRTPITTRVIGENALAEADQAVLSELTHGYRAYYVAPMIEGEGDETATVTAVAKRLSDGPLHGHRVGILHGRMRPADKDRVMREFRDGAIEVLAATTVIEVGIDVPEATMMVVMAAERYGLAQLHQLRGRVGRGKAQSQCWLVSSADADAVASERLEILARTSNGAEVAREDLRLRGPGDLLGARQTGALPLRFAHLIRDAGLIERAGELADEWLRRDPRLESHESAGTRRALERMLDFGFSLGDVA
jgi:ATP-dependent DNA helicase RecG